MDAWPRVSPTRALVAYPDACVSEVLVLENMWRERVWRARCTSVALIFWRVLPLDLILLIAHGGGCNLRATEVYHTRRNSERDKGEYELLLGAEWRPTTVRDT